MQNNINHHLNELVEKRVNSYLAAGSDSINKDLDDSSNKFLRRCAVRNIEDGRVVKMLSVRQELRDILENIYCNTIYGRFEIMDDNTTRCVMVTDWIDAAIEIAVIYQSYQGTPLVLKTISEIAVKEPYSDYRAYFEKYIAGEETALKLEELLCYRNKYHMENNFKTIKESVNMVSGMVGTMREILPEGFVNHDMELQKNSLSEDINTLEEIKTKIITELHNKNEELHRIVELVKEKKLMEEQSEKEKEVERLNRENEELKKILGSLNPNAPSGVTRKVPYTEAVEKRNKKKKRRVALTRKQQTEKLIDLMMEENYSPEKISLISKATENGIDIKSLIKLVESNPDMGTLRETVKFLAESKKTSSRGMEGNG